MKLTLLLCCVVWIGGFAVWQRVWQMASEAEQLAHVVATSPRPDAERLAHLLRSREILENQTGQILATGNLSEDIQATVAYDQLREQARRARVDLSGAEGLGLVPVPLARPAALQDLLQTIFAHSPVRLLELGEERTAPIPGYKRLRITMLCDSRRMGAIVYSLAQDGPWVLAGISATAAPYASLANPRDSTPRNMPLELTVLVDLQGANGGSQ